MSDAGRRLLWHMGGDSMGNGLTGVYMCNGCERPYLVGPDPRVYLVELGMVLGRSKVSHSERNRLLCLAFSTLLEALGECECDGGQGERRVTSSSWTPFFGGEEHDFQP